MITVEPGLIGGEINKILERHWKKGGHAIQYKIGPDPSSIDSAMIGGMVSNNSSGMCCGVSQNTYHTLKDMRVVFADGTVLDTANPQSRQNFMQVRTPWTSSFLRGFKRDPRRRHVYQKPTSITGPMLECATQGASRHDSSQYVATNTCCMGVVYHLPIPAFAQCAPVLFDRGIADLAHP